MPGVVADIRALKASGATLYLWSSGGAEYARGSAHELGIEDCFVAFLPKPHVIVDDQPPSEWRTTQHVYPLQAQRAQAPVPQGIRDPARIDPALETLRRIWRTQPDLRLGQLVVIGARPPDPAPAIFYIEDEKLLEGLAKYEQQLFEAKDP